MGKSEKLYGMGVVMLGKPILLFPHVQRDRCSPRMSAPANSYHSFTVLFYAYEYTAENVL